MSENTALNAREARLVVRARQAAKSGRLRELREACRLTQAESGGLCGVTGPAWARWESGDRVPRGRPAVELGRLIERLERLSVGEAS